MPTNKTPFTFHLDDIYLKKLKFIAKEETRSASNLLEHLVRMKIFDYETQHGVIMFWGDEEE